MAKNRLDFRAHLSRHSHDLSAGYTSSMAPGMLIPQWYDISQPGDTYYLQSAMKARLQNIIRAFYGEVDLHLDYFFVPLQMLYTPFGQVFAQTDDFVTSLINTSSISSSNVDKFPVLDVDGTFDSSGYDVDDMLVNGECYGKSLARLIDALDGNPFVVCSAPPDGIDHIDLDLTHMGKISPWLFAAYQAIYQKYYRNDEFERLNIRSYNFDFAYSQIVFDSEDFLMTRYVQRPKDYFTSVRVSPIASAVNRLLPNTNSLEQDGGILNSELLKVDSFLSSGGSTFPFESVVQGFGQSLGGNSPSVAFDSVSVFSQQQKYSNSSYSAISASNIRALFAVDKFARIYGRADKTYDDQILAHFGIEIPHDVKHDLTHIKHFHVVLGAKPVYGTANVPMFDGQALNDIISTIGEVGGQGEVTLQGSDVKFTAPVHGVIMAVAYAVTKPRYTNTFSKLHWLDNRLAFPIPEFDKLGAQPLYLAEAHPWYLTENVGSSVRVGWQNRYNQFKEKYDRCSFTYQNEPYTRYSGQNNLFAPWVIARSPYFALDSGTDQDSHFVRADVLFESPHALDMIMATPYVGAWSLLYYKNPHLMFQSDPLLTEFYMRCKKVSWMSETGEPDL